MIHKSMGVRAAETAADSAHGAVLGLLDAVLGLDDAAVTVGTDGGAQAAPDVEAGSLKLARGVANDNTRDTGKGRVTNHCHTKGHSRHQDSRGGP